ncbi:MAG: ATP-binding protein [Patescibacteria group bacterium]
MPTLIFDVNLYQIEITSLVIAVVANLGLGFLVWKYAAGITSNIFVAFVVIQTFQIIINYISVRIWLGETFFIWGGRIAMFSAAFYALFFFLFVYTFLERKATFRKRIFLPLFALAVSAAIIALTPLHFSDIKYTDDGMPVPEFGIGVLFFALYSSPLTIWALYLIIRRYYRADETEKVQWKYMGIGVFITTFLLFTLVFLNLVVFQNLTLIPYSYLFTFPFVFFASYAILKHHFLNIRIFATELFAFLIIGISVVQITFARNFTEFIFSLILFLLLIILSVLLIKSMHKEIRYRVEEAAYEDLRKLDEAKSEFITIASHQLRTPLSGLKGYISMAQEGSYGKLPAQMRQKLENMAQATERLISLADSFLNVSRMRSGEIELNRQETDLKILIDSVVQEIKPRAQEKGLTLTWRARPKALPQVAIDQEKIRTVLTGVLDNAVRYTKQGSIVVNLKEQREKSKNKTILISVTDTGKGMTTEELQNAFTSFRRGKTAQALWTEGVGLSLYIAKQFVEAHGGKIWAKSPGKGKGSSFFIELPFKQESGRLN